MLPLELLHNDIKMPLKLSLTYYLLSIKQGLIETMPKINLDLMLRLIMMHWLLKEKPKMILLLLKLKEPKLFLL